MPKALQPPFFDVDTKTGCWIWRYAKDSAGYGQIVRDGKHTTAHRYFYEVLDSGPLPRHLDVCHGCDNPPCVNPSHMFVGTRKQNMQDAKAKGRMVPPPVGSHKRFSDGEAAEIVAWRLEGDSMEGIARFLGIWGSTVRYICNKRGIAYA